MPGSISDTYEGPAGPEWDAAREAMADFVAERGTTPPCRVCGKSDAVICFPDDRAQTICPDCCDKAEHPDEETGHQWVYSRADRDHECRCCGVLRRCTNYAEST